MTNQTPSTTNVSETKVSQKEFLNLLKVNPKNFHNFLDLLLAEFMSNAGTLSKKKLLQNLFCNSDFEVDVPLYYNLAKLLKQEIDTENIKFILKNTIELKDGIEKVIDSIKFLIKQNEKEFAKELFDFFVEDVIMNNQELPESTRRLQINKLENELLDLV